MNPIVSPAGIRPSRPDFRVDGVLNAAVTEVDGEILMLLRVAESVRAADDRRVSVPYLEKREDGRYELAVKTLDRQADADRYDFSDPRVIANRELPPQTVHLTSLSHFRIARSRDGVNFRADDRPAVFPEGENEAWGIEDPRITKLDDWHYITYTAVSGLGAATALMRTKDFREFERLGVIFPPENKDVSIFPGKIGGKYVAYHRPVPKAIGAPNMWMAVSDDLIHWGGHRHLLSVGADSGWESGRIGGGAPSFKTEKGWVHIYHAADKNNRYCLGAFLTPPDDPGTIVAKTKEPLLEPETDYEQYGFFGNVVFTCGVLCRDGVVRIYYGAADQSMALAEIDIDDLFGLMS